MSFLEHIQTARVNLRRTSTVVTKVTGERYVEDASGDTKPLDKKEFGFVADTEPDESAAEIIPNFLYLGGEGAFNLSNLENLKITYVLCLGAILPIAPSIESKVVDILDHPNTDLYKDAVTPAIDFIEKARHAEGRVLVYSNAGVSRAPSVVIAYLMKKKGMTFDEAYQLVKSKRSCIQPNEGFLKQLKSKEA